MSEGFFGKIVSNEGRKQVGQKFFEVAVARILNLEVIFKLVIPLANAITLIDGIMVIGGGLSGASKLFMPGVVKQLNSTIEIRDGKKFSRLVSSVYNLENSKSAEEFYNRLGAYAFAVNWL